MMMSLPLVQEVARAGMGRSDSKSQHSRASVDSNGALYRVDVTESTTHVPANNNKLVCFSNSY